MSHTDLPELDDVLTLMGEAGRRMAEINACEGAAGNISVFIRASLDVRRRFPLEQVISLPLLVPELAGSMFIVSGSGRRLREILQDPAGNLGCLLVHPGGQSGTLYTSPRRRFERLTSEFNSHLAVHHDQATRAGLSFHTILHAQPPYLTFLSHIPRYQEEAFLNRRLLRWQPEMILQFPQGIGLAAFESPGSTQLMRATVAALRRQRLVVWAKHGVMACSDTEVMHAADRIEYAEASARYEYLNLAAGEPAEGLAGKEIRTVCQAFGVQQGFF